jgi:hypothetical protein
MSVRRVSPDDLAHFESALLRQTDVHHQQIRPVARDPVNRLVSVGDTPIDLFAAGAPVGPITTVYEVTNAGETFRFCSTFDPANPAHVVAFKEIAGGTGRKLVAKRGDPVACP